MTDVTIEAGTLLFSNDDDLTATYLLVPYGERCQSNLGQFEVTTGAFTHPTDLTGLSVNLDHAREKPVAKFSALREQSEGTVATFSFSKTDEGRAAFADAKSPTGKRRYVSAEVADVFVAGGKATSGRLFGAALVEKPAFASATLLAELSEDLDNTTPSPNETTTTSEKFVDEYTDEDGKTYKRTSTTDTTVDGSKTTIKTTVVIEEPETPAETEEEPAVAPVLPNTLTASKADSKITAEDRPVELGTLFASIAAVRAHQGTAEDNTLLATLSDLKISGAGSLGAGVIQTNWVGQLAQGLPYVREFITLHNPGTAITAGGKKGYKLRRGTTAAPLEHFDGDWTGNKTAIKSGVGFTTTSESTLARFAIGEDIAREFYDLPGGAEVIEAFMRLIVEDHLFWSDQSALATIIETAGAPIAPKAYPGVDGHDYPDALGQLIQGILAVKARKADGRRDVPTYAIANEEAFEQLLYTPKDLIPEFVNFTVTTDGTATADGNVQVVQGSTGIANTSSVIVGASTAIEFDELAGGPLHIDALDIAKGGIDKAVHGYLQTFVVRPEAIVRVGTLDA